MNLCRRAGLRRLAAATAALVLVVATVAAQAAGAGAAVPAAGPSADAPDGYRTPPVKHVWLIILENKSFEATFTGLNKNSYLWQQLPEYGVLLRQYYGTGHNSENNYLTLLSGQAPSPAVQMDCPRYVDVTPGTPAPDGQTYVSSGCVYPAGIDTLAGQFDRAGVSWKGYMQDMGNDVTREDPTCGAPRGPAGGSSPTYPGVPAPGGASTGDLYVPKHNPFVWFHSVIDSPNCAKNVVPLDTVAAGNGRPATSGLLDDLGSESTTPAFSWITPNLCYDAHDSTCPYTGPNAVNGGLLAADAFLQTYIPKIMASPAFQDDGLIDITFDEGYPPYQVYGNSYNDLAVPGFVAGTNTAQSVVACCNELPGPNTYEPGNQLFGQDTTPGGGVTGSVLISRYITPGTISDQPYNHYSWLRSMENLYGITSGGTDGAGHLGYAGAAGLRPFGPDVYSNPTGRLDRVETTPVSSGTNGTYDGRSGPIDRDAAAVDPATGRPVPDSMNRPFPLYVPSNVNPSAGPSPAQPTYPSPTSSGTASASPMAVGSAGANAQPLAATGSDVLAYTWTGALLVLAGAGAGWVGRRRPGRHSD